MEVKTECLQTNLLAQIVFCHANVGFYFKIFYLIDTKFYKILIRCYNKVCSLESLRAYNEEHWI